MIEYILDCNHDAHIILAIIAPHDLQPPQGHGTILLLEVMDWLNDCNAIYHGVIILGPNDEGFKFSFVDEIDIVAFKLRWS